MFVNTPPRTPPPVSAILAPVPSECFGALAFLSFDLFAMVFRSLPGSGSAPVGAVQSSRQHTAITSSTLTSLPTRSRENRNVYFCEFIPAL